MNTLLYDVQQTRLEPNNIFVASEKNTKKTTKHMTVKEWQIENSGFGGEPKSY